MSNPVVLKIPKQPIRGKSVATLVEIRYFEIKEIWLMWNFKCFIKIFYKFEQRRSNINLKCKLLALVLKVGSLEAQVLISNVDNLSIVNSQANNQQATCMLNIKIKQNNFFLTTGKLCKSKKKAVVDLVLFFVHLELHIFCPILFAGIEPSFIKLTLRKGRGWTTSSLNQSAHICKVLSS